MFYLQIIHFISAVLFIGFILWDRLLFRRFFTFKEATSFYLKARIMLFGAILGAVISGVGLLFWYSLSPLVILKICLAIGLILLFMFCPISMKNLSSVHGRTIYRMVVLLIALSVLIIGKLLSS